MQYFTSYIDWPIRRKLTSIMFITSAILVFILIVGVSLEKNSSYKERAKADSIVLAEVIGNNSTAALSFGDHITGHEILSALQVDHTVLEAALYDKEKRLFARYLSSKVEKKTNEDEWLSLDLNDDQLRPDISISQPWFTTLRDITLSGKVVGYIVIRVDLTPLNSKLYGFYIFLGCISFVLLTLMTIFCSKLIKRVLKPATHLSETMRSVSVNQNYDVSVRKRYDDEIGVLIDGFNHMIKGINHRDDELAKYRGDLENQVSLRTSELSLINQQLKLEIEERKEVQDKLAHAQKMEAIGTLAGGVAHDLNNILSGIVSYPDLLLRQLPEESNLVKPIQTIRDSGKKAAAIVQDLLTLARRGVKVEEQLDVKEIVSLYLCSPEFIELQKNHPEVNVVFEPPEETYYMKGSSVHISKTVMNLVANGVEAVVNKGEVFIGLDKVHLANAPSGFAHWRHGDYIQLTISDNGTGIASEYLDRIFEPFFSRKIMGTSGTGLGMSVVWGTVEDHNGHIEVQSVVGSGTTFTLLFPFSDQATHLEDLGKDVTELSGGGQSILIVDDAPQQREIASGILRHLGYEPIGLASGEEAVSYLKEKDVALVVLDMIMPPGMDGIETYKQIVSFKPEQKAIIASGFSHEDSVEEAKNLQIADFILKPYSVEKLGATIKKVL